MSRILVTGVAGFIGFHTARRLLNDGHVVIGFDSVNDYYDPTLKEERLAILYKYPEFRFCRADLRDDRMLRLCVQSVSHVIHLAAQAGVRHSIDHPQEYLDSNIIGFQRLLAALTDHPVEHLLFASTSSVYGGATPPYREDTPTDWPVSLYSATKRSGEALTHSFAHITGIPTTVMRFFTVYGSWGRPDMALFRFADAVRRGVPVTIYGDGTRKRDFTHVSDVVESIVRLLDIPPVSSVEGDSLSPLAPWRVVNIAGGRPETVLALLSALFRATGSGVEVNFEPNAVGDMEQTFADPTLLRALTGYTPQVTLEQGVREFADWYSRYAD